MILITGATGTTGGATLRALQSSETPVRVLVRDPAKFSAPRGVDVAVGHFEDAASLDAALQGVDHAFLVSPVSPQQVKQESAFVDAARRAGVQHIVRLSALGADQPGSDAMRLGASHRTLEQVVRDSGIAWTFLRPNGFMQNFLFQADAIASQGAFYSSLSPAAKISHIDAIDIGEVAATALTEPGHEGRGYALTGPEGLNDDEVAARLSAALGREIKHVQVPLETVKQSMLDAGTPAWTVDALAELWTFYETGHGGAVASDLEGLLDRPARTFDAFARDNRVAFTA